MFSFVNVQVVVCLFTFVHYYDGVQVKVPVPLSKLVTCVEYDLHDDKCPHYFPIETFKNYDNKMYKLYLKFYVMTTNDATIHLHNGKNGNETIEYVAVIGAASNTYSQLFRNGQNVGLDSHKKDILSNLWATPIVVKQTHCGTIEVSIPNVVEPLLKADASDLDIGSVCFFTWKVEGRWFYNCEEEEDEHRAPPDTCEKSSEIDTRWRLPDEDEIDP